MRLGGSTALIVILVAALVARAGVVALTPDFAPIFDAADFARHASSIAAGDGYAASQLGVEGPTAFRPPLYPLLLAAIDGLGGSLAAQRLAGALLGVVTVLLVYLIADRLWGRRVAVAAGAIAAVFPPLVVLNASLLSETLFLPLVLGAVLAVLRYREDRRLRWALVAGAVCGLAVLTRTQGAPVVLALAVGAWGARPWPSLRAAGVPVALVLAAAIVVAPWVVRNAVQFDRFVGLGTGAGFALAGTYNAESRSLAEHPGEPFAPNRLGTYRDELSRRDLDEAELTGALNDQAVAFMRDNPGYVAQTMVWNVVRVFDVERREPFQRTFAASQVQGSGLERIDSPVVFLGSLYAVLLLALAGVAAQVARRALPRAPLFVWLVPALVLLPALAIYGLPRYRAPADPFLVMFAAVGVVAVADALVRRRATAVESAASTASLKRASV